MKVDIIISQLELQVKTVGKEAGKARKREWLNQGWVKFWIWLVTKSSPGLLSTLSWVSSNLGCFSFVLLCFLFGTEILNHSLNQSVSIPKPVVTWSLALSCLSSSSLFFFLPKSLSSSLENVLLCSDEPVFYLDSKSKCAPFSVIILSTKRSFNDDNPLLCIYC